MMGRVLFLTISLSVGPARAHIAQVSAKKDGAAVLPAHTFSLRSFPTCASAFGGPSRKSCCPGRLYLVQPILTLCQPPKRRMGQVLFLPHPSFRLLLRARMPFSGVPAGNRAARTGYRPVYPILISRRTLKKMMGQAFSLPHHLFQVLFRTWMPFFGTQVRTQPPCAFSFRLRKA